jgi:hypothetical protein
VLHRSILGLTAGDDFIIIVFVLRKQFKRFLNRRCRQILKISDNGLHFSLDPLVFTVLISSQKTAKEAMITCDMRAGTKPAHPLNSSVCFPVQSGRMRNALPSLKRLPGSKEGLGKITLREAIPSGDCYTRFLFNRLFRPSSGGIAFVLVLKPPPFGQPSIDNVGQVPASGWSAAG